MPTGPLTGERGPPGVEGDGTGPWCGGGGGGGGGGRAVIPSGYGMPARGDPAKFSGDGSPGFLPQVSNGSAEGKGRVRIRSEMSTGQGEWLKE